MKTTCTLVLTISALSMFSCGGPPRATVISHTVGEQVTEAPADDAPVSEVPADTGAPEDDLVPPDGDQALRWLLEGNERFVSGEPEHDHESIRRRMRLLGEQHPFAVILGCSDSRVPPELLFDHGFGDLFVIRVAGNVVAEDEAGSIEYAIEHLGTPLIVVLGHQGCGAVTAALGSAGGEPRELTALIERIRPALSGIDRSLPMDQQVQLGVEANVHQSVAALRAIADRENDPAGERARIVGAVYELATGRVRILE